MRIESAAAMPFAWPASCVALMCTCDTVCPAAGASGCIGIAAIAAAGLFIALSLVGELFSLGALRD